MKTLKDIISNASIAAKQKKNRLIAVTLVTGMALLVWHAITQKEVEPPVKKESVKISNTLDTIEPGDLWLHKSESRLDTQDESIKKLQTELHQLRGAGETVESAALETRLDLLEGMMGTLLESSHPSATHEVDAAGETESKEEKQIITLNMGLKKMASNKFNIHNMIPIGSFAKAVLLTGVDAPAAITAADNPVPMLLRVVDNAILPRGIRGKIETCHVTASAYGEISEERVRVRLDKISCTYADGRVFVDNIDGYVTGEDGKSGIRGKVIWREGALLSRSFAAGFLGGVSQGIADASGSTATSPLGTVQSYNGAQLFQQGIGSGAGSALNKLSEYYIKRAEQYHPVIEVDAGRLVDIVISSRKDSKSVGLMLGDVK